MKLIIDIEKLRELDNGLELSLELEQFIIKISNSRLNGKLINSCYEFDANPGDKL